MLCVRGLNAQRPPAVPASSSACTSHPSRADHSARPSLSSGAACKARARPLQVVRAAQSGNPPKPGSGPVSGTATINQKGGSGGGKLQPSFTPPGRLTDLRQENLKGWNDIISAFFDRSA